MPQTNGCPSDAVLRQIGINGMDEKLFAAIEIHVESCTRCQEVLEQFARLSKIAFEDPAMSETENPADLPEVSGFTLLRELGRGAAGVVYLAREHETERLVALKLIPGGWISGPSGRARWLAEARAVASVNDLNIVSLYRVEERPQFYLMVFEFVAGGTLNQRLDGPLQPRQAAMIVKTLAQALGKIHAAGLLHLDLKPSNILVEGRPDAGWSELTLKISDFGIARLIQIQKQDDSLLDGPRGTPAYMAPEQANSDLKKIGKSTDIYSLGVIFYLLLTGRMPFQGESTFEILDRVRSQEPVEPRRWVASIDVELESICLKCLRKAADERFVTAEAFVDSIDQWLDAGNSNFNRRSNRMPQVVRRTVTRRRAVLLTGMLVLLMIGWKRPRYDFNKSTISSVTKPARLDHASWIFSLTRDLDSFHGDELKTLLSASRLEAANMIADRTLDARQLAKDALLLKNLGVKLNNTFNKKHIEISIGFLDLASSLFRESYRRGPEDEWILRELVHCESAFAQIHLPLERIKESGSDGIVDSILNHLKEAAIRLPKISDQRTRLFYEIRLLDYCRENSLLYLGQGWDTTFVRIQEFAASCRIRFQQDLDVPDLAERFAMADGHFPAVPENQSWIMLDHESILKWKWLAAKMAQDVFVHVSGTRRDVIDHDRVWTTSMVERMRVEMQSHGMDSALLPEIAFNELVRILASVSTSLRVHNNLQHAIAIEQVFLEIGNELSMRFPDDPYASLFLSEGHLQSWKNHLRSENPEEALAALRRSLAEARKTTERMPDFILARKMADDRESRIAKFLSQNANNKP